MKQAAILLSVFILLDAASGIAFARGGGASNIMNSPGYQRRLQESRGQVTNQSATQPYTKPPSVYPGSKWRSRGRR